MARGSWLAAHGSYGSWLVALVLAVHNNNLSVGYFPFPYTYNMMNDGERQGLVGFVALRYTQNETSLFFSADETKDRRNKS